MMKWLATFLEEKGIDPEVHAFEKTGPTWGENYIPMPVVIEAIGATSQREQQAIKAALIRIDFRGGDVIGLFDFLAGRMAR